MDPVFVQSARTYSAYSDFYHLVDLSGFTIVPDGGVLLKNPATHIWSTLDDSMMEILGAPRKERAGKHVFWYLERPDANLPPTADYVEYFKRGMTEILEWADEIWVSNLEFTTWDDRLKYVGFGSHPDLRDQRTKDMVRHSPPTFVHIGQMTPRRKKILESLDSHTKLVLPTWGEERAQALSEGGLLIGINRVEGLSLCDPLRWALAAAYRIPVLCESVSIAEPFKEWISIFMAPYEELASQANELVTRPEALALVAQAAWELMCQKHTFRHAVERGLVR